jgi:hypothetical protein
MKSIGFVDLGLAIGLGFGQRVEYATHALVPRSKVTSIAGLSTFAPTAE